MSRLKAFRAYEEEREGRVKEEIALLWRNSSYFNILSSNGSYQPNNPRDEMPDTFQIPEGMEMMPLLLGCFRKS